MGIRKSKSASNKKKKQYTKPEAKLTKISLGVWAGSSCGSCLDPYTHIATPKGNKNVKDLKIGDLVWSTNLKGEKITVPIKKISKTEISRYHKMVFLSLADKRQLIASPDHPLIAARKIRRIFINEEYDNSIVTSLELTSYAHQFTYDLLPDSETGYYWANDILIGSTLLPSKENPERQSLIRFFSKVELSFI